MLKISGAGKVTTDIVNDVTKNENPWARFLLSCSVGKDKFITLKALVFDHKALSSLESIKKGDTVEFTGIFTKNEWTNRDNVLMTDDVVKIDNINVYVKPSKKDDKTFEEAEPF